jgi:hypothetical protein
VSSAIPHPTAHRTCQRVFSDEKQKLAAGLQDTRQLAQAGAGVRQVFQDPAAHDGVEAGIGIWETREVGGDVADACRVQAAAGALQHALGKIKRGDHGIGRRITQQETGVTAVAAARVEDPS